jgi:hypothetical protein
MKTTHRAIADLRADPPQRANTRGKGGFSNAASPTQTAGGLLQEGSFVDLVLPLGSERLKFVHSSDAHFSKANDEIKVGVEKYVPIKLDGSWLRAIRFPQRVGAARQTSELFARVSAFFKTGITFEPEAAELITAFVFSTWFADILDVVPSLWVVAPDATDRWVLLRLLSAVCRRALLLAGCTPSTLVAIPSELKPTLLFEATRERSFARMLAITARRGFYVPRSGRALDNSFAVAVVSEDWPGAGTPLLKIAVPPGSAQPLAGNTDTLENASAELQADLLRYRIDHYRIAREATPKPQPFTSQVQLLATSLTACVDDAGLREKIIKALQPEDEQIRAERATDIHTIAVEALLVACHERKPSIGVGELAELANAILAGRGELPRFTPRGFGEMLRSLGFKEQRRTNQCWILTIDSAARARIHRLGRNYNAESAPQPGCPECAGDSSPDGALRARRLLKSN